MHLHRDDRSLTCRLTLDIGMYFALRVWDSSAVLRAASELKKSFYSLRRRPKIPMFFSPSKSTRNLTEYIMESWIPYSSILHLQGVLIVPSASPTSMPSVIGGQALESMGNIEKGEYNKAMAKLSQWMMNGSKYFFNVCAQISYCKLQCWQNCR